MPARHEGARPVEVGWTAEAEAALVQARESLDRGDDVEGYRLLGVAAQRQMVYEERGVLLGFAICGASGGIMGALIASLLWWLL